MAFSGYQGGMMFHMGYVQSKNFQFNDLLGNPLGNPYQLKGMAYGIGGAIRVGFGKHLRVGMEGYVSTHNTVQTHHLQKSVGEVFSLIRIGK